MLTGRKNAFINPDEYGSTTGYTSQDESEHDFFTIGHTSTSVSLACGLAKARDVKGEKGNVIAVIGDGSLSGGEAYEGLNNAAESKKNIIILVNDNDMSIAENHGGLYGNLRLLRETKGNKVAIIGLGHFLSLGEDVKALLKEEMGIDATLINPRFITGLDEEMLNGLLKNHELIVTLEDGSLDGGFGEKIDRFYADKNIKVLNFGAKKEFTDIILSKDLYVRYHLTKELIVEDIKKSLK